MAHDGEHDAQNEDAPTASAPPEYGGEHLNITALIRGGAQVFTDLDLPADHDPATMNADVDGESLGPMDLSPRLAS